MGKRVLVTGAGGFVGANLTRRFLLDGHDVHVLLRPGHDLWRIESILSDLHVHDADLRDRESVRATIRRARPDWIFHMGVYGAYPTQTDVDRIFATNIIGTANVLETAVQAGFEAFVNTGSSSEYGFADHAPLENEVLRPNSVYAVSKAAASMYCTFAAESRGLPLVTFRLYSVYGPWEEPTRLIPALIEHGRHGRLPPLVGPETARDFVYVDDVVDAYVAAAECASLRPGAVYNVGSGTSLTLADVVATAKEVLHVTDEPRWRSMPQRSWDSHVWISDCRLIGHDMGWAASRDFATGLRETADWFEAHPELFERYRDQVEKSTPTSSESRCPTGHMPSVQ